MDHSKQKNNSLNKRINSEFSNEKPIDNEQTSKILCDYCKRTANNGIRCIGKCVQDSEY